VRDVPAVVLPELFTVQAAATPDAVAVVHGGVSWTYAQLDAWSNRLARYLIRLGAGAGAVGGGGVARSVQMVAAVLAVVKPAPPTYHRPGLPADRISFMLTDAAPVAILTPEQAAANLPTHNQQIILDNPT
jgi:non-ribosomal peptide synthetase component F